MAHAEKCPICYGSGNKDEYGGIPSGTVETCNGCMGRGWVSVQDEPQMLLPYPIPDYLEQHYPNRSSFPNAF